MTGVREQLAEEIRGQHASTNSMGHITRRSAEFLADVLAPLVERIAAEAERRGYERAQNECPPGGWESGL